MITARPTGVDLHQWYTVGPAPMIWPSWPGTP